MNSDNGAGNGDGEGDGDGGTEETELTHEFLIACERGDVDRLRLMVERDGFDTYNKVFRKITTQARKYYHPLHVAATNGQKAVVSFLLSCPGIDVNIPYRRVLGGFPGECQGTALHYACSGGHPKVAELLLDHGANIHAISESFIGNHDALYLACESNCLELARLLIERGMSVNGDGVNIPLQIAVANDSFDLTQLLLEHGADVNVVGKNGWYAIHLACLNDSKEILQLLIDFGANMEAKAKCFSRQTEVVFFTPLHLAVSYGREKIVEVLLRNGADIYNTVTLMGGDANALQSACENGHLQIYKMLKVKAKELQTSKRKEESPSSSSSFSFSSSSSSSSSSSYSSPTLTHYSSYSKGKEEEERMASLLSNQEFHFFHLLPMRLAHHVFSYLSLSDLGKISRVCKKWSSLANDNMLWFGLFERTYPTSCISTLLRFSGEDGGQSTKRSNLRSRSSSMRAEAETKNWKLLTKNRWDIVERWKGLSQEDPPTKIELPKPRGSILAMDISVDGTKIVATSQGPGILLWDLSARGRNGCGGRQRLKVKHITEGGHSTDNACAISLLKNEMKVITGGTDPTSTNNLLLWDLYMEECSYVYKGTLPRSDVKSIVVANGITPPLFLLFASLLFSSFFFFFNYFFFFPFF
jgi:ankyrin repeat protein